MSLINTKYLNNGKRKICGFKENQLGEAIVTTGEPREFKPGEITYINQKQETYESYMTRSLIKGRY